MMAQPRRRLRRSLYRITICFAINVNKTLCGSKNALARNNNPMPSSGRGLLVPKDEQHSVAVSVRIRPAFGSAARDVVSEFKYPAHVLEGPDQESASAALLGGLLPRFLRGGTSCTLMAYGQTGSGKTYTMLGPPGALTEASLDQAAGAVPEAWGCFPRAMLELLRAPELAGATFHASAIEIYMEHAYDLLDGRKPIKVGAAKGSGRGTLVVSDMGKAPVWSGDVQIVGGVHPSGCSCFKCFQKTGGLVGGSRLKKQLHAASGGAGGGATKQAGAAPLLSNKARSSAAPPLTGKRGGGDAAAAARTSSTGHQDEFGTEGETLWALRTPADVARLARLVESERVAQGHLLNDRSSRSHCLIRVSCTHVDGAAGEAGSATGASSSSASSARLTSRRRLFLFVDLAGSERIERTGVTGAMQREAANINQSLTALGRVVRELNEGAAHVSYRDSALTMLLRSSLGARAASSTAVVLTVSGEAGHAEETRCSLRFGEKLATVKTSAALAAPTDVGAQRARLAAALAEARARLAALEQAGQGEYILRDALPSEQKTLSQNLLKLDECEAAVAALRIELVEAKAKAKAAAAGGATAIEQRARAGGGCDSGGGEVAARLSVATEKRDMIFDIVEKEKTIKTLWHPATPAYERAAAQVAALAGQLETLGGGSG